MRLDDLLSNVTCQMPQHLISDAHEWILSSEITAKGTGLGVMAGKEDPVELDSILTL